MSKRNIVFGGFSVVVASAAIAGGAAISSNAMAAGTGPNEADNTVHVVSINTDGEAVSCEYDGVEFPVFVATAVDGGVLAVSGTFDSSAPTETGSADGPTTVRVTTGGEGAPTDLTTGDVESGTVIVSSVSATGEGDVELTPAPPGELIDVGDLKVISTDDARPGTPEECAALAPGTTQAP